MAKQIEDVIATTLASWRRATRPVSMNLNYWNRSRKKLSVIQLKSLKAMAKQILEMAAIVRASRKKAIHPVSIRPNSWQIKNHQRFRRKKLSANWRKRLKSMTHQIMDLRATILASLRRAIHPVLIRLNSRLSKNKPSCKRWVNFNEKLQLLQSRTTNFSVKPPKWVISNTVMTVFQISTTTLNRSRLSPLKKPNKPPRLNRHRKQIQSTIMGLESKSSSISHLYLRYSSNKLKTRVIVTTIEQNILRAVTAWTIEKLKLWLRWS